MYTDLKDKTAIVTGAGKKTGIGCAIARRLAQCGANIVIADLGRSRGVEGQVSTASAGEMEDTAGKISSDFGVECLAVPADVTDTHSVADMVDTVSARFSAIHILCNNAGASFGVPSDVEHYEEADWVKTVDVNLHGVFRASKAVIPVMKKSGGGVIINIASRAGKVPPVFNSAYAAAKAGVIMLSKAMAKELAGAGIRVNAICPGQIMTDIEKWRFDLEARFFNTTAEQRELEMCRTIPLGRIGEPAEVAELAAFLASGASSYITGQAVNITGGQLMEL